MLTIHFHALAITIPVPLVCWLISRLSQGHRDKPK